ncbi:MAG: hypothetical protein WB041_04195, partial [Pseudolabrys sp.]
HFVESSLLRRSPWLGNDAGGGQTQDFGRGSGLCRDDRTVLTQVTTAAPNAHVSVWKKTQASRDNRHQTSDQQIDV